MTTMASSESIGSEFQDALDQWSRRQGGTGVLRLHPIEHWQRPFSELMVFEMECTDGVERPKLVSKRIVHESCNEIYGEPAQLLRNEFNALQEARRFFDAIPNCAVPTARLLLPDLDILVMDFVPGVSLEPSLAALQYTAGRNSWRKLTRQFWQLGRWLHHYQHGGPLEWSGREALESVVQHCDHRLRIVEATRHRWLPAQLRARVLRRIEAWTKALTEPVPRVRCHGDFGPWNVLVHGPELTVLDFSVARQDCAAVDPLNVLVYLEAQCHAPSFSRRRVNRLQQIFLRGYACEVAMPIPMIATCEALQRICRLQDCLCSGSGSLVDRYRHRRVFRENVRRLLAEEQPLYLDWPRPRVT
jgi:hypothetical protein